MRSRKTGQGKAEGLAGLEGAPRLRGRAGRGLTFSHQQDPHVFLHVGGSQGPHSARTHGAHASRRVRPACGAALPALPPLPASLSGLCSQISAARTGRTESSATAPLRSRGKPAPPPPAPRTRAAAARTTACGEGHAVSERQRSRVWNSAPAGWLAVVQNPGDSPVALWTLTEDVKWQSPKSDPTGFIEQEQKSCLSRVTQKELGRESKEIFCH